MERPTQAEVGAELGKSQQAVSDSIRKGHLKALARAESAMREWLDGEDRR